MAITYPRELHSLLTELPRCVFDYEPLGAMSRTAGGMVTFQETAGGSLWRLSLTTKPLKRSEYDSLHAWFLSLRGGAKSFKAYDPHRCFPLAYGPDYPDGAGSVTSVDGDTIDLAALAAGQIVSAGDYISFPYVGGQALVKALETATANGSGVIEGLTVGPWQRTGGTLPAVATLVRAWCEMRPVPGTWAGERTGIDPVSFEAIQTLPE